MMHVTTWWNSHLERKMIPGKECKNGCNVMNELYLQPSEVSLLHTLSVCHFCCFLMAAKCPGDRAGPVYYVTT
jgi:hypothetical protein